MKLWIYWSINVLTLIRCHELWMLLNPLNMLCNPDIIHLNLNSSRRVLNFLFPFSLNLCRSEDIFQSCPFVFVVIVPALLASVLSCHCRWSFHWQSLLPATDHCSLHYPPGSPGSLLWLLGCWIPTHTRRTRLTDAHRSSNSFWLISPQEVPFSPPHCPFNHLGDRRYKQYSYFTRNIGVREARLVFLKAIDLNSTRRALEKVWMSLGGSPDTALQ